MARTKNYADVIKRQLKADPKLATDIDREALNAVVAALIYNARLAAKLTQRQLADRMGTRQSVIARLEDWDYTGHSLSMLRKVADAVGMTLHVELRPQATQRAGKRKGRQPA